MSNTQDIISSLNFALEKIEDARNIVDNEIDRDNPKNYETLEDYMKCLDKIANDLKDLISTLERL